MRPSELDAIRAFIKAAEDLLPYCNEDATDDIEGFLDGVREHLAAQRDALEADQREYIAARKRFEHECLVRERGIKVLKGGKL